MTLLDGDRSFSGTLRHALSLRAEQRCAYLIRAISEFQKSCTADDARQMGSTLRRLISATPMLSQQLLSRTEFMNGATAAWLRAYMLEFADRPYEAAETFLSIKNGSDEEARAFALIRAAHSFVSGRAWDRAALVKADRPAPPG